MFEGFVFDGWGRGRWNGEILFFVILVLGLITASGGAIESVGSGTFGDFGVGAQGIVLGVGLIVSLVGHDLFIGVDTPFRHERHGFFAWGSEFQLTNFLGNGGTFVGGF